MSTPLNSTGTDLVSMLVGQFLSTADGDVKKALVAADKKRQELANEYNSYDLQTPHFLRKALADGGNEQYNIVMEERFQGLKKKDKAWQLAKDVYDELNRMHKKRWLKDRKN